MWVTKNTCRTRQQIIRSFYRHNGVNLEVEGVEAWVAYEDRAPTREELSKAIQFADLRGKAIISFLALSGVRIGTLVKLKYKHVKEDLERGLIPVRVHVDGSIHKARGKINGYDTFIGAEAVEYLKAYLNQRRQGSLRKEKYWNEKYGNWEYKEVGIPEKITEESPLFRTARQREVKPLTESRVYDIIHNALLASGVISPTGGRRYVMWTHSLRKFFKTQMEVAGISSDLVEYMMGHTLGVRGKYFKPTIEQLRVAYIKSGISIVDAS